MLERFLSVSERSLDDKGRLSLPSQLRAVLTKKYDENLVVTLSSRVIRGQVEKCLHLYPMKEFEAVLTKLDGLPSSHEAVQTFRRRVVQHAEEVQVDKQGRVLIPTGLRERAGLSEKAFVVGDSTLIQVWNPEDWERERDVEDDLVKHQQALADFGL